MKKVLFCLIFVLTSTSVLSWDTKTNLSVKVGSPEWKSIYLSTVDGENEHQAIAAASLAFIGVTKLGLSDEKFIINDLNASFFRRDLEGIGALLNGDVVVPRNLSETLLEERSLPQPSQFAGLPDFSYTISDWVNKNILCPSVPPSVQSIENFNITIDGVESRQITDIVFSESPRHNICHSFLGWMGLLNSNHFGSQATANYKRYHGIALERAEYARALYSALEMDGGNELEAHIDYIREVEYEALSFEGMAQHFFQDRWASGHMWERWGSSDWQSNRVRNPELEELAPLVHAAALAGFIHGHESNSSFRDLLSSPSVAGVPMDYGSSAGAPLFQGVGDHRYNDMLDGDYTLFGGEVVALSVIRQRDDMMNCLAGGWAEVVRSFSSLGNNKFGAIELNLNEVGMSLSIDNGTCFDNWASNKSMFLGLNEGIGIGEDGLPSVKGILGQYRTTFGTFLDSAVNTLIQTVSPSDIGRKDRMQLFARLWGAQWLSPSGTEIAQGGGIRSAILGSLSGIPTGNNSPNPPDYAEPISLANLPDETISEFAVAVSVGEGVLKRPGLDKPSIYGFFNRAHTEWWCKKDNLISKLAELRDNNREDLNVEVCTYLASRVYRGTDARYKGAQSEKQRFINDAGARINADPVCELPLLNSDLTELNEVDTDPAIPNILAPGYVSTPDALAKEQDVDARYRPAFGYDSIVSWCSKVPIMDLIKEPGDPSFFHSDDVVAEVSDPTIASDEIITGLDFGDVEGLLLVGNPAAEVDWLTVTNWTSTELKIHIEVDEARGLGDFPLTIQQAVVEGERQLSSVGQAILRIGNKECSGNITVVSFVPELEDIKNCTVIDGNLTINIEDSSDSIILPVLKEVTGNILIFGGPTSTIELPQLIIVGGFFRLSLLSSLESLFVPRLNELGGSLILANDIGISSFTFPALKSIRGNIELGNLLALTSFLAPSLASVDGGIGISRAPLLKSVDFQLLENIGPTANGTTNSSLSLTELPVLENINISNLLKITGSLSVTDSGNCDISNSGGLISAPALTNAHSISITQRNSFTGVCTVNFPSLQALTGSFVVFADTIVTGIDVSLLQTAEFGFSVSSNKLLSSISAGSLTSVNSEGDNGGVFIVSSNPVLTQLQAGVLTNVTRLLEIRGNVDLRSMSLGAQGFVDVVQIVGNRLSSFSLDGITEIRNLQIISNPELKTFSLGGLINLGGFLIESNKELVASGFGIASSVNITLGADIINNDAFAECFAKAFCANVENCDFTGNDDSPPWPDCGD